MNAQQLQTCTGCPRLSLAESWLQNIEFSMVSYGINTPLRQAAFIAQIGHESGGLRHTTELWGPTSAQSRYEGRDDLGNNQPGDGALFRGHGLIQVTGRANHAAARDALRGRFPDLNVPDFETIPEALALPQWAALSAAEFWARKGLNALADTENFERITRRINGGTNGLEERQALYRLAKKVLVC